MFGKKSKHPEEISVEQYDFLHDSVEIARLWVENQGPATCLIQPDRLAEPEMFGMLMVDTVRHGSRAYSQYLGISEEEALKRIWQGLDAERGKHTTELDTLQDYSPPDHKDTD